jgi:hypothetical protein
MRTLLVAALLGVGLLLGGVSTADARRPPLDRAVAVSHAEQEARKLARQDPRITEWEIARGFRFTSTKWVFAWWAQLSDGRICTAQLVSRYRNSKQRKVIAYFRNQDCS